MSRSVSQSVAVALDAKELFTRVYGRSPAHSVQVPVPVQLVGAPRFAWDRLAIGVALNRFVQVAVEPRVDGKIELVWPLERPGPGWPGTAGSPASRSTLDPAWRMHRFWVGQFQSDPEAAWADPVKAALTQLSKRNVQITGFSAALDCRGPVLLGLETAGALALATSFAVRRLTPFALSETGLAVPPRFDNRGALPPLAAPEKKTWAQVLAAARLGTVAAEGDPGGFLTLLFSRDWQVVSFDLASAAVEAFPLPGLAFVAWPIPGAGARREDWTGCEEACRTAALKMKAKSLRRIEVRDLEAARAQLGELELACAKMVAEENRRSTAAERALLENDHRQFGLYVSDSSDGVRRVFGDGGAEAAAMLRLARGHPACLGAAVTPGPVVCLVPHHLAADFVEQVSRSRANGGEVTRPIVCQPVAASG